MSGIEPDVDSETSSQETSSSVSQDGRNTKNETFASEATVSSSDDADLETLVSEDHPLLTRKERWGWYLYDGANSVFLSVSISGYIPVLVTDLAKYHASSTTDVCQVYIGSIGIRPAAYASTVLSISVLIQAILFITTSAMADYGNLRKRILLTAGFLGALLTSAFIFMFQVPLFWLAGLLLVLSNVFFGYSIVFYNAFLPGLVRSSRKYIESPPSRRLAVMESVGNQMSTRGYMVGYAAGIFLLAITFPIVLLVKGDAKPYYDCKLNQPPQLISTVTDSTLAYRIAICMTGVWWFFGMFFPTFMLNPRPGPPLPPGRNYVTASLISLKETILHIRKLPNTMLYLIAYFMFSDGYSTITNVGVLFATQELNAPGYVLGIMLAIVPVTALIGNFFWLRVQRWKNIPTKRLVMILILLMLSLPAYGCIGFISGTTIGMKNIWELYLFAGWYGFNVGAVQSFSRTLYMSLTPQGHESEFFGFYELTDKGSSWIGTAVTAGLTQATGSLRYSLLWILAMFGIPILVLYFVDMEKGMQQAKTFAGILDESVVKANEKKSAEKQRG